MRLQYPRLNALVPQHAQKNAGKCADLWNKAGIHGRAVFARGLYCDDAPLYLIRGHRDLGLEETVFMAWARVAVFNLGRM